jgi:hypothetical protein
MKSGRRFPYSLTMSTAIGRSQGLDALDRLKNEHARLPEALDPAAWLRTGLHESHGEFSTLDIARHAAAHDAKHLAQIAAQRRRERTYPPNR